MAKCAAQHGAGRRDGANTRVKTIQYLAEAECLAVVPCSTALTTLIWTLLLSSPDGTLALQSTGCTSSPLVPKSVHTVELIKDVLSPPEDLLLPSTRFTRFVLADLCRLLDDGTKLFAYLDDWVPLDQACPDLCCHMISQP